MTYRTIATVGIGLSLGAVAGLAAGMLLVRGLDDEPETDFFDED